MSSPTNPWLGPLPILFIKKVIPKTKQKLTTIAKNTKTTKISQHTKILQSYYTSRKNEKNHHLYPITITWSALLCLPTDMLAVTVGPVSN